MAIINRNPLRRWSMLGLACTTLLTGAVVSGTATAQQMATTGFEFSPPPQVLAPFTVFNSPLETTFSAGAAQTIGQPLFYNNGAWALHIRPGETSSVTFESMPSAADFFWRTTMPGTVTGEVRFFDENEVMILTQAVPTLAAYEAIGVIRMAGESLIKRVEIENTGAAGDVLVDDFSITADPAMPPPPFDPNNPIPEIIPTGITPVVLTEIASGFTAPLYGKSAPGDTGRLFIVDQVGRIEVIDLANNTTSAFLDISATGSGLLVDLGAFGPGTFDERGLLGLAFHPNYATNGLFYTYTSEPVSAAADFSTIPIGETANHQSVVREFTTPDPADPASVPDAGASRELLRLDEPQFNHNAGALDFDALGYMLIAVGDGGGADDEGIGHGATGNGQDTTNPFGAVLRIDPMGNNSANGQYGIPATNPFVGMAGQVEEIYAWGMRNPFRMAFDVPSGDLYVADVGQNHIEEVNIVNGGENFGWNLKEGTFFFEGNGMADGDVTNVDPGVPAGLIDPVAQYDHDEGIAIVGGFVYHGTAIPMLADRYVFGDFGGTSADAGRLFYLNGMNEIQAFALGGTGTLPAAILGFAQDANGEIYVLTNTTGTPFGTTGTVSRLDLDEVVAATSDFVTTDAGMAVTIDVLGNDTGKGNAPLTVTIAMDAANGTAAVNPDNTVTYTPNAGFNGDDTFNYTVTDSDGDSATTTATVTVGSAPPPPPAPGGGGGGSSSVGPLSLGLLFTVFALLRRRRVRLSLRNDFFALTT